MATLRENMDVNRGSGWSLAKSGIRGRGVRDSSENSLTGARAEIGRARFQPLLLQVATALRVSTPSVSRRQKPVPWH